MSADKQHSGSVKPGALPGPGQVGHDAPPAGPGRFPNKHGRALLGLPRQGATSRWAQAQVLTAGASHNGGRVHCDMQLVAEGHPLHTGRPDGRGAWPDAAGRMPVGGRSANQRAGLLRRRPQRKRKKKAGQPAGRRAACLGVSKKRGGVLRGPVPTRLVARTVIE